MRWISWGARRDGGIWGSGGSRVVGENLAQNRICAKLAGRTKGREIRGGLGGRFSPNPPKPLDLGVLALKFTPKFMPKLALPLRFSL